MGRLHLFEFLDQPWFPSILRDPMTAYLETIEGLVDLSPYADKVREVLAATGATEIVDLGSGSTGPILHILPKLAVAGGGGVQVRLTDLYPSQIGIQKVRALNNPGVVYDDRPVDATDAPADLTGMRTIFATFHHFRPAPARKVLEDAYRKRAPIGVFEFTVRSAPTVITTPLIALFVLLLTPMIRPFSWRQIFFTYLVPVLPLLIFWDGLVSHLRTYSARELRELVKGLDDPGYRWEIGELKVKGMPAGMPYLVGKPV